MGLMWKLLLYIKYLWYQKSFKNILPEISTIENPKLNYEILSGSFYWEDEGLEECPYETIEVLKSVIMYRTHLLITHTQEKLDKDLKFYKRMYYRIKKRNPNWIGFQEERCSYSAELEDRYRRIEKVSEWKIEKMMNED